MTYSTEYADKTWIGDEFSVEITDPCLLEDLMQIEGGQSIVFATQEFTYELCQSLPSTLAFAYT